MKSLELHIPEISTPVIFDDIDGVYKTKGIVQIKALAEGEFTAREKKSSAFFCEGIHYACQPVDRRLNVPSFPYPMSQIGNKEAKS